MKIRWELLVIREIEETAFLADGNMLRIRTEAIQKPGGKKPRSRSS